MGTINYKTSDYITLAEVPIDFNDIESEVRANPEDYGLSDVSEVTDEYIYDIINELYDDDRGNVEAILNKYDFEFFELELEHGYYEGFEVLLDTDFDFYSEEDRQEALKELPKLEKALTELAGVGMVSCTPGWSTGYEDYNGTIKDIKTAIEELTNAINAEKIDEGKMVSAVLIRESSAYSAKLSQFLDGQDNDIQRFVKDALNKIFLGIKKDFGGYIEGKRPTIKDYGKFKTLSMQIQANNALKPSDEGGRGTYKYYYPVEMYCDGMGKILNKKFNGDTYQCVLYNHNENIDDIRSGSEYDDLTSTSVYPMVGAYLTGANGRYKNLDKNVAGNTYSIIVSVPNDSYETYNNPFMTKSGNRYTFANDTHDSQGYEFTLTYDMSDGEFSIRKTKDDSYDTFNIVYRKSRKAHEVFNNLAETFSSVTTCADVEKALADNGIKIKHSWWFNPYYD